MNANLALLACSLGRNVHLRGTGLLASVELGQRQPFRLLWMSTDGLRVVSPALRRAKSSVAVEDRDSGVRVFLELRTENLLPGQYRLVAAPHARRPDVTSVVHSQEIVILSRAQYRAVVRDEVTEPFAAGDPLTLGEIALAVSSLWRGELKSRTFQSVERESVEFAIDDPSAFDTESSLTEPQAAWLVGWLQDVGRALTLSDPHRLRLLCSLRRNTPGLGIGLTATSPISPSEDLLWSISAGTSPYLGDFGRLRQVLPTVEPTIIRDGPHIRVAIQIGRPIPAWTDDLRSRPSREADMQHWLLDDDDWVDEETGETWLGSSGRREASEEDMWLTDEVWSEIDLE